MSTNPKTPRQPARARVRRGNADDAAQLRTALLDEAMALFREGGLEAVTMRAVASKVGISTMAPYRYFNDKGELLAELWQWVMTGLYEAMVAAIARQAGAASRYRVAVEAYFTYYEEHPDEFWLAYQTQQGSHASERPGAGQAEVYSRLLALVRQLLLDLAGELGATEQHVKDAEDLALLMQMGYLQASLVNRRYPWGDLEHLRAATVVQIMRVVSGCLLHGPLAEDGGSAQPSARPRIRHRANQTEGKRHG